ncbi:helical backbone metal receptor [Alteromonas ponticola]|uniref:ABC transporter substrate-binding protein n=1 Tax=Alteromonas ponticola TaxID=2720613 RepID=A0ABX1QZV3_9ALTE|nr:helical backbone metal receptor [Alteromonas ponticola]NMH59749.1 ABC transporter substrate-binding protein [Alteromonas ponticola]
MKRCKLLLLLCIFSCNGLATNERIITLSPHLTEWVYSLEREEQLIAVSEFSNFPEQAKSLPTVANHHGINLKRIVALRPTLILAWEGGNKEQDIARLRSLGFEVFTSSPQTPQDIGTELSALAKRLDKVSLATTLVSNFTTAMTDIKSRFGQTRQPVFYYYWDKPLMTIGTDTWANQLLNHCGAETLFSDAPVDFPEVTLQQVLKRRPVLLIASINQAPALLEQYWAPHRHVLSAPLIQVNPDVFSRFTLRLPTDLRALCQHIDTHSTMP